jgi:hypothetical protein
VLKGVQPIEEDFYCIIKENINRFLKLTNYSKEEQVKKIHNFDLIEK